MPEKPSPHCAADGLFAMALLEDAEVVRNNPRGGWGGTGFGAWISFACPVDCCVDPLQIAGYPLEARVDREVSTFFVV